MSTRIILGAYVLLSVVLLGWLFANWQNPSILAIVVLSGFVPASRAGN